MITAPAPAAATRSFPDRDGPLALAAAGVTVLLWASAFVAIRFAGPHFSPGSMALLRMVVGSVVLGLIAARSGIRWPAPRDRWKVAGWGLAWFCLYNLALNTAERMVDAGTAAMIVNLAPLIVVLLAGLLLGEGYPRTLVIGAPLSFAGVVLIGSQSTTGHAALLGLALCLAAALLYAACTLVQKHLLRTVDSASLTWLGACAGTVGLLPWAPQLARDLAAAPAGATATVLYLGIFPTAIAFTTWAYALRRGTAGRTSATTYVVPALVIVLSWLALGEVPTLLTLAGGALCLLGVAVARLRP